MKNVSFVNKLKINLLPNQTYLNRFINRKLMLIV